MSVDESTDHVDVPCVQCQRVNGEIFWLPVAHSAHSVAALANHQRSRGALLIVPRSHARAIHDLSPVEAADLYGLIRQMVQVLAEVFEPDGVNIWQGGRTPEPQFDHVHNHVCPRYLEQDSYSFAPSEDLPLPDVAEREELAAEVASGVPSLLRLSAEPVSLAQSVAFSHPTFRYATSDSATATCPVCPASDYAQWPVVLETSHSIALVPSRQPHLGTTLVIPKRHVRDPRELTVAEADDLYLLLREMVAITLAEWKSSYYHASQYLGLPGGEPIDHLHWRLEPRTEATAKWMPIDAMPKTPATELAAIARRYQVRAGRLQLAEA